MCNTQQSRDVPCPLQVFWYAIHFILWAAWRLSLDVCTCCKCLFIILRLKSSCHSLAVCYCSTWLTTHLGKYADMMLLYSEAWRNGRAAHQLYEEHFPHCQTPSHPSLPRFTSGPWRQIHSLPAGLTVVLHSCAVPPSWKRLYSMHWKKMWQVPDKCPWGVACLPSGASPGGG